MLRELFAHRASRPPPIHTRLPSLHASYTRLTATLVFLPPLLPSCPPLLPLALPMRVRCAHKRAGADSREGAGGRRTGGLLVDEDDALLEEDLDGRQVAARGQYQRVSRRSCEAIDSSHASARFLGHLHRRQAAAQRRGRRDSESEKGEGPGGGRWRRGAIGTRGPELEVDADEEYAPRVVPNLPPAPAKARRSRLRGGWRGRGGFGNDTQVPSSTSVRGWRGGGGAIEGNELPSKCCACTLCRRRLCAVLRVCVCECAEKGRRGTMEVTSVCWSMR